MYFSHKGTLNFSHNLAYHLSKSSSYNGDNPINTRTQTYDSEILRVFSSSLWIRTREVELMPLQVLPGSKNSSKTSIKSTLTVPNTPERSPKRILWLPEPYLRQAKETVVLTSSASSFSSNSFFTLLRWVPSHSLIQASLLPSLQ